MKMITKWKGNFENFGDFAFSVASIFTVFTFHSTLVTPCASAPCFNGGTCSNNGTSFTCRCALGFAGHRCEIEGI